MTLDNEPRGHNLAFGSGLLTFPNDTSHMCPSRIVGLDIQ